MARFSADHGKTGWPLEDFHYPLRPGARESQKTLKIDALSWKKFF
jgi:hypothetical protein